MTIVLLADHSKQAMRLILEAPIIEFENSQRYTIPSLDSVVREILESRQTLVDAIPPGDANIFRGVTGIEPSMALLREYDARLTIREILAAQHTIPNIDIENPHTIPNPPRPLPSYHRLLVVSSGSTDEPIRLINAELNSSDAKEPIVLRLEMDFSDCQLSALYYVASCFDVACMVTPEIPSDWYLLFLRGRKKEVAIPSDYDSVPMCDPKNFHSFIRSLRNYLRMINNEYQHFKLSEWFSTHPIVSAD